MLSSRASFSSSFLIDLRSVHSRSSNHLFLGRHLLLTPAGLLTITFFTILSSDILLTCACHSSLLLFTQSPIFWIPHSSLTFSLLTLSSLVTFVILLSVFISVVSNICDIFDVSALVSAACVSIGRTIVVYIRTLASVLRNLLDQIVLLRQPDILDALIA